MICLGGTRKNSSLFSFLSWSVSAQKYGKTNNVFLNASYNVFALMVRNIVLVTLFCAFLAALIDQKTTLSDDSKISYVHIIHLDSDKYLIHKSCGAIRASIFSFDLKGNIQKLQTITLKIFEISKDKNVSTLQFHYLDHVVKDKADPSCLVTLTILSTKISTSVSNNLS